MLLNEIESYWTNRAEGYSKINKHELAGVQRMLWGNLIEANMPEHLKNVKNKKIDINQIDKSVEKIIKLKEKYNITDEPAKGCNIDEINRKIEKINMKLQ